MDPVRKLILDRARDLDTNLSELSKGIGKNHAYLQQFIRRGVPRDLPEKVRPKLAHLISVNENALKLPDSEGVNLNSKPVTTPSVPGNDSGAPSNETIPGADLVGRSDLPVYGTAQGGRGALVVSSDVVGYVLRPDPLLKVKDGYGMIVTGDSMSPEHKSGSTALVNPHLPPRTGDTCVFWRIDEDGTRLACIKELRRFTDTIWFVKQHNPKKEYVLKRSEWQLCHVTVGNYSRR